jgi:hypothetical protein
MSRTSTLQSHDMTAAEAELRSKMDRGRMTGRDWAKGTDEVWLQGFCEGAIEVWKERCGPVEALNEATVDP